MEPTPPDDPWRRPDAAGRRLRLQSSSRARRIFWTNGFRAIAFILGGLLLAGAGTFLVAADAIDADQPEYWGTFTHEDQESRGRWGKGSVGTWVSDDRTIRLDDVSLIGHTGRGGIVEARYRPDGPIGDEASYTVHTAESLVWSASFNWFLIALGGGTLFLTIWLWRRGERM
ncbi:MAG: hypothetical protein ABWX92_03125 [Mycetocola sp.]